MIADLVICFAPDDLAIKSDSEKSLKHVVKNSLLWDDAARGACGNDCTERVSTVVLSHRMWQHGPMNSGDSASGNAGVQYRTANLQHFLDDVKKSAFIYKAESEIVNSRGGAYLRPSSPQVENLLQYKVLASR